MSLEASDPVSWMSPFGFRRRDPAVDRFNIPRFRRQVSGIGSRQPKCDGTRHAGDKSKQRERVVTLFDLSQNWTKI
jgi:hypothetical protein